MWLRCCCSCCWLLIFGFLTRISQFHLAPHPFPPQSSGGGEYGFAVDWWALGILVYEMICGETPFYSDDLVTTYSKIMSHATSLHLPKDIAITPSCLDFIKRKFPPLILNRLFLIKLSPIQ